MSAVVAFLRVNVEKKCVSFLSNVLRTRMELNLFLTYFRSKIYCWNVKDGSKVSCRTRLLLKLPGSHHDEILSLEMQVSVSDEPGSITCHSVSGIILKKLEGSSTSSCLARWNKKKRTNHLTQNEGLRGAEFGNDRKISIFLTQSTSPGPRLKTYVVRLLCRSLCAIIKKITEGFPVTRQNRSHSPTAVSYFALTAIFRF